MVTTEQVVDLAVSAARARMLGAGLTTGEAAAVLGVSESTVKRWCDTDKLYCTRRGTKLDGQRNWRRIPASSVAALMEELHKPIPYTVTGVDLASRKGDVTVKTVLRRNPDGTTSLVSSEPMESVAGFAIGPDGEVSAIVGQVAPAPTAALSEDENVEAHQ